MAVALEMAVEDHAARGSLDLEIIRLSAHRPEEELEDIRFPERIVALIVFAVKVEVVDLNAEVERLIIVEHPEPSARARLKSREWMPKAFEDRGIDPGGFIQFPVDCRRREDAFCDEVGRKIGARDRRDGLLFNSAIFTEAMVFSAWVSVADLERNRKGPIAFQKPRKGAARAATMAELKPHRCALSPDARRGDGESLADPLSGLPPRGRIELADKTLAA